MCRTHWLPAASRRRSAATQARIFQCARASTGRDLPTCYSGLGCCWLAADWKPCGCQYTCIGYMYSYCIRALVHTIPLFLKILFLHRFSVSEIHIQITFNTLKYVFAYMYLAEAHSQVYIIYTSQYIWTNRCLMYDDDGNRAQRVFWTDKGENNNAD